MILCRIRSTFLTVALLFCFSSSYASDVFQEWLDLYQPLLQKYVVKGKKRGIYTTLVDYNGLRGDTDFRKVIYDLARLPSFETLPDKKDQLAMWINAYNVLCMKIIVENPKLKSIKDLDSAFSSIWKKKIGVVSGKKYSLDEIEHDTIRARFNEPRIHFAVNCASLSCPDLANYAYRGEHLDEQLDHQTQAFLSNKTKGMNIAEGNEKIYLSKIFKWYSEDFSPSVKEWLESNKYITQQELSYKTGYLKYDWALNSAN
ncbi:DUF547 domain-containing protein [Simkania sp.]|uniref:DUF547 domain-containing protein n=1 Tax=Simkania sp. TaxID=34094 RepID=UPI003B52492D